ncbi:hypothetical protein ANN_26994 [Periplaneta americana]|uniref:Uncharacterized protein n=1 Tax=Periplaneta americana TaxID=6978 RepID=A0ABQ8RX33_PERAM|nr:hypothetical protein ANN_26994 [Periplaneta americana]
MMYNLFSYSGFCKIFKENFNYKFGQPQVDCCCTCEELKLKIKSPHINDPAKRCAIADLAVHNRKSKQFYAALKEEFLDELKGLNNNVLSLSFDYMINVSLPKVPVQDHFYLRQLTVNLFCVHDIKKHKAVFYC